MATKTDSASRWVLTIVGAILGSGALGTDAHAGQPILGVSARGGFVGSSAALGGEVMAGYAPWPGVRFAAVVGYDKSFDSLDDDRIDHAIALQGGGRLTWPMSWVVRPFVDLRLGALIYNDVFPDRWVSGFLATFGLGIEVSVHERVVLGAGGWLSYIPFVAQWGLTATWLLGR